MIWFQLGVLWDAKHDPPPNYPARDRLTVVYELSQANSRQNVHPMEYQPKVAGTRTAPADSPQAKQIPLPAFP